MTRVRRPAATALAVTLTLAAAGCGAGEGPPTTGLATRGAPESPRATTTPAPPPTTAPAPEAGAPTPEEPTVTDADRPLPCPSDRDDPDAFDARELAGRSLADAKAAAERHGCSVRVARRDGQDLMLTRDFSPARINVEVEKGRVIRVLGVS